MPQRGRRPTRQVQDDAAARRWADAIAAGGDTETLLTDTGSVKRGVVAAADGCSARPGVTFVGSHPMAGSERSGFGASDPELFAGRLALVTETAATDPGAVAEVAAFWESLGSHVRTVSVDAHDRGVAVISHLVHLAAYGLVTAADGDALSLAARGFVDTTRIAASAEALWTDIFRENRPALLEAIDGYRRILDCWEGWIRAGRWEALEAALAQIERQFGKGAVMRMGERPNVPVEVIPTGSTSSSGSGRRLPIRASPRRFRRISRSWVFA